MDKDTLRELLASPLDDTPPIDRRPLILGTLIGAALAIISIIWLLWPDGGAATAGGTEPPARSTRVALTPVELPRMTVDPTNGRIIVFGGRALEGARRGGLSNRTWQLASGGWWWLRSQNLPEARIGHSLDYDTDSGVAVMFGGTTDTYEPCFTVEWCGSTGLNDTWTFAPATGNWTQRSPATSPSQRFGHAAAYDAASDRIVMFGGATIRGEQAVAIDDTWVYDADTDTWDEVQAATAPPPRAHAAMVTHPDGRVLLVGGAAPGLEADLWRFDPATQTWLSISDDLGIGQRSMMAAAIQPGTRELIVIGGTGTAPAGETSRFRSDILTVNIDTGAVGLLGSTEEPTWRHAAVGHPDLGVVTVFLDHTYRLEGSTLVDITDTLLVTDP